MGGDKAQSLAEYAVLVALIIAAVGGIEVYLKRGLQARYKTLVDASGIVINASGGTKLGVRQYEPYYLQSAQITDQKDLTNYTYKPGGAVERQINSTLTVPGASQSFGLNLTDDDAWNSTL